MTIMIAGYSNIQIRRQNDNVAGGGWFYNFMDKPSATGNRRVYYGWMSDDGPTSDPILFTGVDQWEGYPSMDLDERGHFIMSWHSTGADDKSDVKC